MSNIVEKERDIDGVESRYPISIVLPVHNGSKELESTVRIILASMGSGDELLVIDDNSTDGAIESIRGKFSNKNFRILPSKGVGLVDALNTGISESVNEWLARYDVGDYYSVRRLSIQRNRITPEVVAVFSDYIVENLSGQNLGYISSAFTNYAVKLSLLRSQRTPHPSALIRKSAVMEVGGYKTSEFPAEDLGLWLRLSVKGEFASAPHALLIYRLNPSSITGQNYNLSKDRTQDLIRNSVNVPVIIDICRQAFLNRREILEEYDSLSRKRERKLLFLLDLLSASRLNYLSTTLRVKLLAFSISRFLDPFFIPDLLNLLAFQRKRAKMRKLPYNGNTSP